MSSPETTTVEGVLSRFVWRAEETEWIIAEIDTGDGVVIVKGPLRGAVRGGCYRVEGVTGKDRFGQHIKIRSSLPIIPKTEAAIRAFLETLPNIGHGRALTLVTKFGTSALDKLRTAELEELKAAGLRLGEKALGETRLVLDGAESEAELKLTVRTMLGDEGSDKMVEKVLGEWGDDAANVIREHPWRLADLPGVGFVRADAVARHLGHDPESPERIVAGVVYAMEKVRSHGDTATFKALLVSRAAQVLDLDSHPADYGEAIVAAIDELRGRAKFVGLSDDRVQFMADRHDECDVADTLRARVERTDGWSPATLHETGYGELAEDQVAAVKAIVGAPTAILVGPPGTGKTYAIRALLPSYRLGKIKLCAPTGKAARRLSEATGHRATTIHTLLEPTPVKERGKTVWGFGRNASNPLEAEVVIVDEVSMIDTRLFRSLLEALPSDCRLVLVGDEAQLPSVGPGAILRDLLESELLPVARLTEIKRTNPGKLLEHIHAVRAGEWAHVENEADSDLFVVSSGSETAAVEKIVELYLERLPKMLEDGDPILDIQLLLPWKTRTTLSTRSVNELIQRRRAERGDVTLTTPKFGVGDKVIQTLNDYDLGIVNGDVGVIQRIAEEKIEDRVKPVACYHVRFQGYPDPFIIPAFANDLELAYAMTVHKSQGSEWPIVVVPALGMSSPFYDRALFYTALSRAKRIGVVVGQQGGLFRVLGRSAPERRRTNLVECLLGDSKAEGADGV